MTTNELYAQMGVSQRVLDFGAAVLAEIACTSPPPPATATTTMAGTT